MCIASTLRYKAMYFSIMLRLVNAILLREDLISHRILLCRAKLIVWRYLFFESHNFEIFFKVMYNREINREMYCTYAHVVLNILRMRIICGYTYTSKNIFRFTKTKYHESLC